MRKLSQIFLFVFSSCGCTAVMKSYRLVWDTGKIASFGFGVGYNIFNAQQPKEPLNTHGKNIQATNNNVFGSLLGLEAGITGYEYSIGIKCGKSQSFSKRTYLFTFFTGRSTNWIDLKTNIETDHYVFGVRINQKFIEWSIKYHTDFESNAILLVQFGLGE